MTEITAGTRLQANFGAYDADNKYVWCNYTVEVVRFISGSLGNIPVVRDVSTGDEFTITNLAHSIKDGRYKIL